MDSAKFAAIRKHDRHTGIDLHCLEGSPVYAIEAGKVVNILKFTGAPESPWWQDTFAVMIEGESGVILYGELAEESIWIDVGDSVLQGDFIGKVKAVLPPEKKQHRSMLHLELYVTGTRDCVWWPLNEEKPNCLLDPTTLLS